MHPEHTLCQCRTLLQVAQADPRFMELAARLEQAVERVEGLLDKQQVQRE